MVDQKLYDRIISDVPKMRLITKANLMDKYKLIGAVSRRAIRELLSKQLIKIVGDPHAEMTLYTGVKAKTNAQVAAEQAAQEVKKGGKK